MAIESGIGMTASIDDGSGAAQVITDDISNLSIGLPRAQWDVTGLSMSAPARVLLLADLSLGLNGGFNDDANMSHAVFKTVPSQSATQTREVTLAISGQTLTAETLPNDYALSRAAGGEFTWAVTLTNADGNVPAWS